MGAIRTVNLILGVTFFLCYAYQFFYIAVPLLFPERKHGKEKPHRFAVLIAARNEEAVIGNLIASIRAQTYDPALVYIFVVADNCTDGTAIEARNAGAEVFVRREAEHVGKGYALNFLLNRIGARYPEDFFDAYLVFDADNVLDAHYFEEINRTFSDGYEIVTSYRNSKNYGDNWISAGYALWFLRESRFLNDARMRLGTSCAVSGTGFLFSREVLRSSGGWKFFLLTEDIEFTVHHVCEGRKVGFCRRAMLYDEQPIGFRQSVRQRLRWSKGYLQVFGKYGKKLIRGAMHGSFSCFDMTMTILPAAILSAVGLFCNLGALIASLCGADAAQALSSAWLLLRSTYLMMFAVGGVTLLSEWKRIRVPVWKKLLSAFTFPIFMLTYIPIAIAAIFARNVGWKPIEHRCAMSAEEVCGTAGKKE